MSEQLKGLVEKINALYAMATPGPWKCDTGTHMSADAGGDFSYVVSKRVNAKANMALLGALANDWPTIATALQSLMEEKERLGERVPMDGWLIWSNEHHAWWAANKCGYRSHPNDAGRYSFADARSICRVRGWVKGVPPETMLHESEIPWRVSVDGAEPLTL